MKEATGEVSMTVIVIVILALIGALGAWIFGTNGPAKNFINNFFTSQSNDYNNAKNKNFN